MKLLDSFLSSFKSRRVTEIIQTPIGPVRLWAKGETMGAIFAFDGNGNFAGTKRHMNSVTLDLVN